MPCVELTHLTQLYHWLLFFNQVFSVYAVHLLDFKLIVGLILKLRCPIVSGQLTICPRTMSLVLGIRNGVSALVTAVFTVPIVQLFPLLLQSTNYYISYLQQRDLHAQLVVPPLKHMYVAYTICKIKLYVYIQNNSFV